jgi:three-Cys-motif partner protein
MTADDKYWAEYSNLQRVKHELIRRYLGGWFAKLGSWAGKVLYLDTHAGRGKHLTGQLGSPLIALDTLLKHSHHHRLLQRCEFVFYFIEKDGENLDKLNAEIASLGAFPVGVRIYPVSGDCFSEVGKLVASLRSTRSAMAPAFVFVDPYGFKIPAALLRDLMTAGRVELLISPEPDLKPLRSWIVTQLKKPCRWSELSSALLTEIWREPHLATVLRSMRRAGEIEASGYQGRFGRSADPLLKLKSADGYLTY